MLITLNPACFEGLDPTQVEEGHIAIPHAAINDTRITTTAKGILYKLISRKGDYDIEAAKAAELKRRAAGNDPEDLDALLAELEDAGWITMPTQ